MPTAVPNLLHGFIRIGQAVHSGISMNKVTII